MNLNEEILNFLTENQRSASFIKECKLLKESNKCLDGIGINYNKEKIFSIKLYLKIVEKNPKINESFKMCFFQDKNFFNLSQSLFPNNFSSQNLNRNVGVSGTAFSFRNHLITGSYSKSVSGLKLNNFLLNYSRSITEEGGEIKYQKYYYIFNSFIKKLFLRLVDSGIPIKKHALEVYPQGESIDKKGNPRELLCCTIYPIFSDSIKEDIQCNFKSLSDHNPWSIEKKIIKSITNYNSKLIGITKGYQLGDFSRKMYFSSLSYNFSSFL